MIKISNIFKIYIKAEKINIICEKAFQLGTNIGNYSIIKRECVIDINKKYFNSPGGWKSSVAFCLKRALYI